MIYIYAALFILGFINCDGLRTQSYRSNRINKFRPLPLSLDTSAIHQVEGFAEAFIGGTVGIMGTMMALEVKTKQDAGLDACPYCMGYGEILCASCLGNGIKAGATCPCCGGGGAVECINCKGDGRVTPLILQNQSVRDPDSAYQAVLTRTNTIENP